MFLENDSVRLKKLTGVLTVAIAVVVALPAFAGPPDEAPRATVRYRGDRIQRAHLTAWCWPGKNGGMGCSEVSPMTWPRVDVVSAGARIRLRMHWKRRPKNVHVDSYRSIRRNGKPKGRGQDLKATIRAVERKGDTVAWDVIFRVTKPRRHYIKSIVQFRKGTLVWNAHVDAR
jgi:hypothetical protein